MVTNPLLTILQAPSDAYFFILDIDSTLLTTYQRNQAILDQFIFDNKTRFAQDCEKLVQAQCQLGDYGLKSSLERIQFQPTQPESLKSLEQYWRENFFTNHYLHKDIPVPGAVKWVQQLQEKNIQFIYLTARHKKSMWSGTLESLSHMGFPINENILFLKEDLNDSDELYKAKTLKKLNSNIPQENTIFIDNEPLVLHKVSEHFPNIQLVWFNSTHSGKMEPPQKALAIKNFNF